MKNERGFMITTKVIKKRLFRDPVIEIEITDGRNTTTYYNQGTFLIETDKNLIDPVIWIT